MAEQLCRVSDDVVLCYETFGERTNPPVLLVMGLATQMIGWPDDFCQALASRGLYVVRFDNRDIGRSTHVDHPPPALARLLIGARRVAPYTLTDMASDAAGLLRELDLAPAHVIGASMGGAIAQMLAAQHPASVRSLVSIMATTGGRRVGQPAPTIYRLFFRKPPKGRQNFIERTVSTFATIGSTGLPQDTDLIREMAERGYDRDHDPAGPRRQLAAILASGDRTAQVRRIAVPTLVIHGTADRLVRPSGGRATARAIRGAGLMLIDGMGHDLPRAAWPEILDAIVQNVARSGGAREPV